VPQGSVPDVHSEITSYATLNDNEEFVIAYYLVHRLDRSVLNPPLLITRFEKKTGEWSHVALSGVKVKAMEDSDTQVDCLGSVLKIQRNAGRYYLALHWNPSAGCSIILNHDLRVSGTLGGDAAGFLHSGLLLYTGNTIHFASVHPTTLFAYDPVTHHSQKVYPQKPDPLRQKFSSRLRKVTNESRCRENNWTCNPEEFESDIVGQIEVGNDADTLAFRIDFSPSGFISPDESENSGQWDNDQYVYIYQMDPFRWREFSVYDLKPMFGTDSLEELLQPQKLRQIFATAVP